MRRAGPPDRSTVQILLAYANAICLVLTEGVRRSRVEASDIDSMVVSVSSAARILCMEEPLRSGCRSNDALL